MALSPGKNVDHIKRAVDLRNLNANDMIFLFFNKTVKNFISNYIPHETVDLMIKILCGLTKLRKN